MKKVLAILVASLFAVVNAFAAGQTTKNLDISVVLSGDGSATITEVWHVSVSEGTEWYLDRRNLGDMQILNLSVTDETGLVYENEGSWNVNRSLTQKAGKCGLAKTGTGYEICWGLGSHGTHTYTVTYVMTNAVKSLNDADCFHMQLVNSGLSAPPKKLSITLSAPVALSEENSRIWGFGLYGDIVYQDGKVVMTSLESMTSGSSAIELIRFDKGIFSSQSVEDRDFQEVLDRALDGSDFADGYDEDDGWAVLGIMTAIFGSFFGLAVLAARKNRKNILGLTKLKDVPWHRDVPFGGNLMEAFWVLKNLGMLSLTKNNTFATAMVLKMIKNGQLTVQKDSKGKIEIAFSEGANLEDLSKAERGLYDMMKEASGQDVILQDYEFSRWSKRNTKRVNGWVDSSTSASWGELVTDKYVGGVQKLNPSGQAEARKLIGFKKFLSDFTLSKERSTQEVIVWQDYLIYASLFGIADKVAKELKDINPKMFEEVVGVDPYTYTRIVHMSSNLANSITNAQAAAQAAAAKAQGGYGGHTSFGGGGGFHGGGFGGGAR